MPVSQREQRQWLCVATNRSRESPDPSTKNGAVIVHPNQTAFYCGCNTPVFNRLGATAFRLPPRADIDLNDRDEKLVWTEHAERTAVFSALTSPHNKGGDLAGWTLYCPYLACADCARAIVLSGVRECVRLKPAVYGGIPERWKKSVDDGDRILAACGVTVIEYDGPPLGMKLFLDKKEWDV